MEQYLIYNAEHKVVICREHKYGIGPRSLERHFRNEHRGMSSDARKQVLTHAKELPLCEPDEAPMFKDVMSAIHGLQIHDGFRCDYEECGFYAGTLGFIKRHCREHANWQDTDPKFHAAKVQTLFQGHHTRYYSYSLQIANCRFFEVHDPERLQPENFTEQLLLAYIGEADQRDIQHGQSLDDVNDIRYHSPIHR